MPHDIDQLARATAPRRIARLAGLLYLVVALCGLFAQMYARATVHVPGDATATAANIVEHSTLFRLGFVADLVTATSFMLLGMALFQLFKAVNREVAGALVVFVAVGAGMILVNLLYHFAALLVATDASYASLPGGDALVLLLIDLHQYGYSVAGIVFGLWLLPLGYLAYTSGMFPRVLGAALMVACGCYLVDTLVVFVVPDRDASLSAIVTAPAAIAEFWMVGYLLLVGVRRPKPAALAPVPG